MNTRIPSHLVAPPDRRHLLRIHEAGGITIDRSSTSGTLPGIYATYGRTEGGVALHLGNPAPGADLFLTPHSDGGLRLRTDA